MAAPVIYTSADASAPVLTGEVGKLNDLLHACLVTGYGAKAAAGWTRPYNSGSSYAAFRPDAGLRHYLAVNDTNAQMARVVGYETMSDFITGTGPFPTEAQFSGGLYARKSTAASATARPWFLAATDKAFHLFINGGSTTFGTYGGGDSHLSFGQLSSSYLTGDAYHSYLVAASDTSTSSTTAAATRQVLTALGAPSLAGHYLARNYTQAGSAVAFGKRAANLYGQTTAGAGGSVYPDPILGSVNVSRIGVQEAGPIDRGWLPGILSLGHAAATTSFTNFDTFSGDGTLSGRTFTIVLTASGGVAIETTDGSW